MVRKIKLLDDDYIEGLRARIAITDEYTFDTCLYMADYWDEMGEAIIHYKRKEQGWTEKQAPGRAHRWWLASSAAEVGSSEGTMYNYVRIGRNFIQRGLKQDNLTADHMLALMLNAERNETHFIPEEIIKERLEWLNKETDKFHGQVPSARDIKTHYRKNGDKQEWELLWANIVRNAKKLWDIPFVVNTTVPTQILEVADRIIDIEGEHVNTEEMEAEVKLDKAGESES